MCIMLAARLNTGEPKCCDSPSRVSTPPPPHPPSNSPLSFAVSRCIRKVFFVPLPVCHPNPRNGVCLYTSPSVSDWAQRGQPSCGASSKPIVKCTACTVTACNPQIDRHQNEQERMHTDMMLEPRMLKIESCNPYEAHPTKCARFFIVLQSKHLQPRRREMQWVTQGQFLADVAVRIQRSRVPSMFELVAQDRPLCISVMQKTIANSKSDCRDKVLMV